MSLHAKDERTTYFDGPVSYTRNMFMKCTTGGGERQETEEEETQQENCLQVKTFLNWQNVVGQNASANNSHSTCFLVAPRQHRKWDYAHYRDSCDLSHTLICYLSQT